MYQWQWKIYTHCNTSVESNCPNWERGASGCGEDSDEKSRKPFHGGVITRYGYSGMDIACLIRIIAAIDVVNIYVLLYVS